MITQDILKKEIAHHQHLSDENDRIQQILNLIPGNQNTILEVGARHGYLSHFFTKYAKHVVALDLVKPEIVHKYITPVQGDVTNLEFANSQFDTVICTEVLEHISPQKLAQACDELTRVTKKFLIIGVPYNQDTRCGRTTCRHCGHKNPPWGHVNVFDEKRLTLLFSSLRPLKIEFTAANCERTNSLSTLLLDFAGNPWGTYSQDEPCVNCGQTLLPPNERNFTQKVATRIGFYLNSLQRFCSSPKPTWIHILFEKPETITM